MSDVSYESGLPILDEIGTALYAAAIAADRSRATQRRLRAPKRWGIVGAAGAAGAVAVLVLGTTASGPANAFAGWSATPTLPQTGEIQTAEAECGGQTAPTLVDTRGPFALLLFAQSGEPIRICTSFSNAAGQVFEGGVGSCATRDGAVVPCIAGGEASDGTVDPDAIAVAGTAFQTSNNDASADRIIYGQIGADVTAVTLVLNDGSQVHATTANGLFGAWWPGTQGAQTATITTTTGTTTQALNIPPTPNLSSGLPGSSASGASGTTGATATGTAGATVTN